MNILSFETSCGLLSVSLYKDGIITSKKADALNQQSKLLFTMINELLLESSAQFSELDALLLSRGPGSFTGVRIGIAAALGIQSSSDLKVYGFSTMQSLASRTPDEKTISIIAGNDSYYTQEFDGIEAKSDIEILTATDANIKSAKHYGHIIDKTIMPDSLDLINLYLKLENSTLSGYIDLAPLYVKAPYF